MNRWQMLGFLLANLCGMTIVLIAVEFYTDVIPLFTKSDSFIKPGQVVITKHVGTARTLSGEAPVFKPQEIDDLRQQPFVKDVGTFTPSHYGVYATIGSDDLGMEFSTEMFLEAIPDAFIDVDLSRWKYQSGSAVVPIILPRNYLNLYNFGFAASKGMPTISEDLIKLIKIRLMLHGPQGNREVNGRVVAFSKRLNTILVPQIFMDEMNQTLSPDTVILPSRLVVQLGTITDERFVEYLEAHNYETEADDADAARTVSFVRMIAVIVMVIGLIISVLAFYLLLLSIFLLLQKHTEKIDNLLVLGYSPNEVSRPYHLLAIGLNSIVLLFSILLASCSRQFYLPLFGDLYPKYEVSSFVPTIFVGIILFILVAILNFSAIRRKILLIWNLHKETK